MRNSNKMWLPTKAPTAIDGERLACAARNRAQFSELVHWYRSFGFTDAQITQAIADASTVISPLGGTR